MSTSRKSSSETKTREFLEGVRRRCPDNIAVLEALGDLYTKHSLYEQGLEIDLFLTERFPENDTYWYNLSCSYARVENPEKALTALQKAIVLGYDDVLWMTKDEDLASLRGHPEFTALVESLKNRSHS